jgi:hypothetical protein
MVRPVEIAGRLYISDVEIQKFLTRANAGEFASAKMSSEAVALEAGK